MPDVTIPTGRGDTLKAYLSAPFGTGPWPGVVVVHDVFGLSSVTRAHADRLASYGYVAAAPDLYTRGGMVRCVRETFRSMTSGTGRAYEDIQAVRAWLIKRDDTKDRTGVIGFCMGGGFALMTAGSGFAAAAPNYGPLPKDLAVLDGACPIVGSYGGNDRSLKGAAPKLEEALRERGILHDVKEYPGAGHCFLDQFHAPFGAIMRVSGMGYHEASATDAWQRIERFFAEHLD